MGTDGKRRAREYETIYILRPDVDADTADKVATRVTEVIDKLGGKLLKVDNWGRRRLEYTISKHHKGIYILLRYLGFSDMVAELERNLRMTEAVMKYQTVLMESDVDAQARATSPEQIKFGRIEPEVEESVPEDAKIIYRDADEYVSGKPTIVSNEHEFVPADAPPAAAEEEG